MRGTSNVKLAMFPTAGTVEAKVVASFENRSLGPEEQVCDTAGAAVATTSTISGHMLSRELGRRKAWIFIQDRFVGCLVYKAATALLSAVKVKGAHLAEEMGECDSEERHSKAA